MGWHWALSKCSKTLANPAWHCVDLHKFHQDGAKTSVPLTTADQLLKRVSGLISSACQWSSCRVSSLRKSKYTSTTWLTMRNIMSAGLTGMPRAPTDRSSGRSAVEALDPLAASRLTRCLHCFVLDCSMPKALPHKPPGCCNHLGAP